MGTILAFNNQQEQSLKISQDKYDLNLLEWAYKDQIDCANEIFSDWIKSQVENKRLNKLIKRMIKTIYEQREIIDRLKDDNKRRLF